jgi:tetratricopeptide (TPR) repeat protein
MLNTLHLEHRLTLSRTTRSLISLFGLILVSACATSTNTMQANSTAVLQIDAANSAPLLEGTDIFVLNDLAVTSYQQGDLQQALRLYKYLVNKVPEDADLWFRLGNVHARLSHTTLAMQAYEKALLRDPRNYKAWRNISAVKLREAADALTQLMKILPPYHELFDSSLLLTTQVLALISDKPTTQAGEVELSNSDENLNNE